MINYDEKAKEIADVHDPEGLRGIAAEIAAFGRECAAQAYEDAMKIAERTANEYLDWSPVAWNACDDVRIDLRIKLDALRQGDESK